MKKLKTIVATMSNKTNHNTNSSSDCKPDNYHVNAKICRLVEQYPCMYDRSHVHYLKKDVVDQAWVKIAEQMNDSISSCKERWRNIRTSYARSINVNKIPFSANRTKPYYLHEELQFLSYHITPGIPVSRRSAPTSVTAPLSASASHFILNSPNSFNPSPIQSDTKCENINVMVHEESFDSYAAALQQNDSENDQSIHDSNNDHMESINQHMHDEKHHMEMLNEKNNVLAPITTTTISLTTTTTTTTMTHANDKMELNKPATVRDTINSDNCNGESNAHDVDVGVGDDDDDGDNDDVIESTEYYTNKKSFNYACAPPKKRLRIKDNRSNSNSLDTIMNDVKPIVVWPPANDYDGIFLQSLLPEMKVMNFHQKILFKRRVYEILTDIFDNHQNTTVAAAATETATATIATATTVTSTATSISNITASSTAIVANSSSSNSGNNRSKRKINQVNTCPATITPPMVDIADSNMLRNFNETVQDTTTNISNNAANSSTTKTSRKMSLQKSQHDLTESATKTSTSTQNNVNPKSAIVTTSATATAMGKVGAITRSCTNSKRLRSSQTMHSITNGNQMHQQQQYHQQHTIKQELDTNDNRNTDQI